MQALQLHDKQTEDIIGTILITDKNTNEDICRAWDKYQEYLISNDGIKHYDIWNFVNHFPEMGMEVVEIYFYQP